MRTFDDFSENMNLQQQTNMVLQDGIMHTELIP